VTVGWVKPGVQFWTNVCFTVGCLLTNPASCSHGSLLMTAVRSVVGKAKTYVGSCWEINAHGSPAIDSSYKFIFKINYTIILDYRITHLGLHMCTALAFFEHINFVYGCLSEFCQFPTCPAMTGPGSTWVHQHSDYSWSIISQYSSSGCVWCCARGLISVICFSWQRCNCIKWRQRGWSRHYVDNKIY